MSFQVDADQRVFAVQTASGLAYGENTVDKVVADAQVIYDFVSDRAVPQPSSVREDAATATHQTTRIGCSDSTGPQESASEEDVNPLAFILGVFDEILPGFADNVLANVARKFLSGE